MQSGTRNQVSPRHGKTIHGLRILPGNTMLIQAHPKNADSNAWTISSGTEPHALPIDAIAKSATETAGPIQQRSAF